MWDLRTIELLGGPADGCKVRRIPAGLAHYDVPADPGFRMPEGVTPGVFRPDVMRFARYRPAPDRRDRFVFAEYVYVDRKGKIVPRPEVAP